MGKSLGLTPFSDYWLSCYLNNLLSIAVSRDPSYGKLACINSYFYERKTMSEEDGDGGEKGSDCTAESLKLVYTGELYDVLWKIMGVVYYYFRDENNFLTEIRELIADGKIPFIRIDLFYWIPDGYCFNRSHWNHNAMITGFDEERAVYYTFEDNINSEYKLYEIPEERFRAAFENANNDRPRCYFVEASKDVEPYKLPLNAVLDNAKRIVSTLQGLETAGLWQASRESRDYDYFMDHSMTEMTRIANRHLGNRILFKTMYEEGLIKDDLLSVLEQYTVGLQKGWSVAKNNLFRYRLSQYEPILAELHSYSSQLLLKEKEMWEKLLCNTPNLW